MKYFGILHNVKKTFPFLKMGNFYKWLQNSYIVSIVCIDTYSIFKNQYYKIICSFTFYIISINISL